MNPPRPIRAIFKTLPALLAAAAIASADQDPHQIDDPLLAEAAMLTAGAPIGVVAAPAAGTPDTIGTWAPLIYWTPHIPVTAATLPDGRLLTFSASQRTTFPLGKPEFTYAAVWDPETGVFTEINNFRHDMFCSGTAMLPDGRLVINGGTNTTVLSSIFDYRTNQWSAMQDMNDPRWYNPSVAMPDGTVFTVSGSGGRDTAELWNSATGWRRLTGVDWNAVTSQPGYITYWHPFLMLAPNGKLFHFGPTDMMNWVTTAGVGSRVPSGQTVPGTQYPKEGAWAMYDAGRILVTGGSKDTVPNPQDPGTGTSTNLTYTVDLNAATPVVAQAKPMIYNRQLANSVVLPNGEVMIVGGNTSGLKFSDEGAVLTPEIWNPVTGDWRAVANMANARAYHSLALLLPNGTVWSGGGGLSGGVGDHQDAQVFTPPNLYDSNGSLAVRPTITDGPARIGPGSQFTVRATPGLTKFSFIRMASQTHAVSTDLRYLSLPFTETSPGVYTLTGHANSNVMVPGYWMLFGLNPSGVHSVAKIIQVTLSTDVILQNPGNQESVTGDIIQLPMSVSALPGITLNYTATGLPAGLSVNPATGLVSGTITGVPGNYATTLNATPSVGALVAVSFNWKVSAPNTPETGGILREWWNNVPGDTIADLTANPSYPANPSGHDLLPTLNIPANISDNYGQRFRGYLQPLVTGAYHFWITGDDQCRLLLSTDATAGNAVDIASVPSAVPLWSDNTFPQQASAPITLVAGKRYYIEALMKAGGGGDHFAVGWMPPGVSYVDFIQPQFLSPYNPALAPLAAWQFDEPVWNGTTGEVKERMGTVGGIHGTALGGAVTSSAGPAMAGNPGTGRMGLFNGGQQVSIPFNAALNPDSFTVSAWVRPASPTSAQSRTVISSRQINGGEIRGFGLYASADGKWKFSTGSPWTELTGPAVVANEWTHLAVSFSSLGVSGGVHTGIRRLFVNGAVVAEDSGNYVPVTAAPFLIGAAEQGGATGEFMNGGIDEVRFHATPLNSDDVSGTMTLRHRINFIPTVTSPGALTNLKNSVVSQVIQANDIDSGPLTFSATGLPGGLSISPGSGIISGTANIAGEFNVTVTATDAGGEGGSVGFAWSIRENLSVLPTYAPPSPAGTAVTLTATSSGGQNPCYQWNFGDGSPDTAFSASTSTTHNFPGPGRYLVTITATDDSGGIVTRSFYQAVHAPLSASKPVNSSPICHEHRASANDRVWVVNPDNDSVTVIDAVTRAKLAEIPVGTSPRCVAVAPDGRIWVTNAVSATVSIISQATLTTLETVALPHGSRPFGLVFSPDGAAAYITLEDTGKLLKLHPLSGVQLASTDLGKNVRHLSIPGDSSGVYVSRFITPRLPGEETAAVSTSGQGGEVVVVNPATGGIVRTLLLHHSEQPDTVVSARGIPNYLGSPVISPDGLSAWVPSKQDNVKRGKLRDNQDLTHDMGVRSIASRINLTTQAEDLTARVDFDNAGVPSAVAFDPWGIYAFVALEASRAVAVVDVWNHREILRFDVGRAPQGLAVSPDGHTLFVHNFMDRSVGIHDITALIGGIASPPPAPVVVATVTTEKLPPQTLLGKQLFYDAKDNCLALEGYLSCAACHNDGGQDGRVWDFTGFGEGLRNTITLRGHGGNRQGPLHWSGNFDEVQDFENQIRNFAGGLGLISGSSPHPPLGSPNAGRSADLDALAAYLQSLGQTGDSPRRAPDGGLTTAARAGELVFRAMDCASCHGGPEFTRSAAGNFPNIGTLKPSSGQRLGAPLTGIDIPTLRGVWNTAPYLHDGSAATLEQAVTAHQGVSIGAADLTNLVAYLESIDDQPATAPTKVTGMSDWLATYGLTAAPDADSDGDSVSNAVEYVIGGNPANAPDATLLPTAQMATIDNNGTPTEYLCFTYRRTDLAHMDPTTTIAAEWAPDLSGTWVTADGTHGEIIQIEDPPGETFDRVKVFVPRSLGATGVLMIRLRVTTELATE